MRKELLKAFEAAEADRKALLTNLDTYSEEVLTRKPSPDAWSVVEVLAHLIKAETGTLNYLRKKLEVGGHQKASPFAGLRKALLNFVLGLPIRFKAPKVAQLDKGVNMSYAEAKAQWNAVRDGLGTEYQRIDEKLIAHDLFKHPFAGKLNLIQSTEFMRQHMVRHIGQVQRTLAMVGKKG
ncbi:MAG: DinB family protein [Flavobacteriales bacterium]|nr:DinB family protein [Flavobacteriales bacterium]